MPPGKTQHLAPHCLAEAPPDGTAIQLLRDHDLGKSVSKQEMLNIMEAVDDSVMREATDVSTI